MEVPTLPSEQLCCLCVEQKFNFCGALSSQCNYTAAVVVPLLSNFNAISYGIKCSAATLLL